LILAEFRLASTTERISITTEAHLRNAVNIEKTSTKFDDIGCCMARLNATGSNDQQPQPVWTTKGTPGALPDVPFRALNAVKR
jgi:hypothetical protein